MSEQDVAASGNEERAAKYRAALGWIHDANGRIPHVMAVADAELETQAKERATGLERWLQKALTRAADAERALEAQKARAESAEEKVARVEALASDLARKAKAADRNRRPRDLERERLANEAHEAALKILRARLEQAEAKVARVQALLDGLCVGHLDHTILQRPCPPCGNFQARLRGALDGDA